MTGIILAGGNGTRLRPLTYVANKHLLPVYDKPMIYYPILTLKTMGCEEIIIISGGDNIGGFAELLGNGSIFGVTFTYRVQEDADGVAGALLCAEGLVRGEFPVILGDNYFSIPPRPRTLEPTIFYTGVEDPERFGVLYNNIITEKPSKPLSNNAVVGFYIYDETVFEYIKTLQPSGRKELEITDVNNWYLQKGAKAVEYQGYWSDMGTFNSLLGTAIYVKNSK